MPFGGETSRRDVLKAAVAVGGAAALSACLEQADEPVPTGVSDPTTLPERQHAWNDYIRTDEHGNHMLPRHQVLWYLDLPHDGPPTADEQATLESALRTLDRAYERSHDGLLYSVAYSPSYFERFETALPEDLDLPQPRRLSDFETPEFDTQDVLVHFASDRPDALLEAEEAMRGERDTANATEVSATITDVLDVADRRTGFVGAGMPADRQDVAGVPEGDHVPEESPLFMGFVAGFVGNQATEDYVTLESGPFAGGTTKHVANIRQRLDDWYVEDTYDQRVDRMFSPIHRVENLVEGVGANLGDDNGLTPEIVENVRDHAEEFGVVGHAQKAARGNRDDDGNVRLLRRHFESTDDDVASLHFPTLQRGISAFEEVREAMNGTDLTDVPTIRQRVNNGILEYIFVRSRGNFLVPPRHLRSFPTPEGRTVGE
ncbi:DUF7405 family protein [Salinirubrum litoreum]|uniref:Twin-arginine translocation signal domain-containing protein n=1 Tax=Salinirubrum litoreum TaxID=1126234 RepID=A0ABD5R8N9_9EURY|nr:twin-arginine translocation signal domain-containing protein [Salinirubrum litoreum]